MLQNCDRPGDKPLGPCYNVYQIDGPPTAFVKFDLGGNLMTTIWTPLFSFVVFVVVFALGDIVAEKTKGLISAIIVGCFVYLVGSGPALSRPLRLRIAPCPA